MQASAYLGDLGGLSAHRSLVLLDLRGTGESAVPADPASYRCDRLVDDVEALRAHLGIEQIDLLGHSAGGALAVLYAARYPDRIGRLELVTPSPRAVGLEITDAHRRQVAELRLGQPWFPEAFAAFERIWSGDATAADWNAIVPFTHGRWDAVSMAHHAKEASQTNADRLLLGRRPRPGSHQIRRRPPSGAGPTRRGRVRRRAPPEVRRRVCRPFRSGGIGRAAGRRTLSMDRQSAVVRADHDRQREVGSPGCPGRRRAGHRGTDEFFGCRTFHV